MELKLTSTIKGATVKLSNGFIGEVNAYFNPDSTINNIVVKVKAKDKITLIAYFNITETRFNANFDFSRISFAEKRVMAAEIFDIVGDIFNK